MTTAIPIAIAANNTDVMSIIEIHKDNPMKERILGESKKVRWKLNVERWRRPIVNKVIKFMGFSSGHSGIEYLERAACFNNNLIIEKRVKYRTS